MLNVLNISPSLKCSRCISTVVKNEVKQKLRAKKISMYQYEHRSIEKNICPNLYVEKSGFSPVLFLSVSVLFTIRNSVTFMQISCCWPKHTHLMFAQNQKESPRVIYFQSYNMRCMWNEIVLVTPKIN